MSLSLCLAFFKNLPPHLVQPASLTELPPPAQEVASGGTSDLAVQETPFSSVSDGELGALADDDLMPTGAAHTVTGVRCVQVAGASLSSLRHGICCPHI